MSARTARTVLAIIYGLMIAGAFALGLIAASRHARAESAPGSWWQRQAVRACCSDADAVYADEWTVRPDGSVLATVTGGGPRSHAWAPIGRVYEVPADKVLREPGNPTGRPLLFISPTSFNLYCFAVGAGT